MMEKHRNITKMKRHYKNLNGEAEYRRHYENFRAQWELTHEPIAKAHPEIRDFREFAVQTDLPADPPTA
jgi:hypothetical protein